MRACCTRVSSFDTIRASQRRLDAHLKPDTANAMLRERLAITVRSIVLFFCTLPVAYAQPTSEAIQGTFHENVRLTPPQVDGPVVVRAAFQLLNISRIADESEEVAFSGVLTLVWKDARQSFDPEKEGMTEKVFSGAYQFNELAAAWYPQVTLANAAGQYESQAIILRIMPDGTTTLSEKLEATARVDIDMHRLPFDRQRLKLVFRIFGFDATEVAFDDRPNSASADGSVTSLPQWTLKGIEASVLTLNATDSHEMGDASAIVVTLDVKRQPLFMLRLVVFPLALIVVLSWAVFWMDRSSVGDRMSVSFVGILAAVAYQITLVGIVPNVSYTTLLNGFLNISFLLMSATVVINLYVGAADRSGHERGDRIDRRCRWLFPLTYVGLNAIALAAAFIFF